jgi:uncharacterized protein
MDDRAVVAAQIGRPPRSPVEVVARCHLGLPVVIRVPPILDDGTPFPTSFWLSCPLAVSRVSRVESHGGVRTAEAMIDSDAAMAARHEEASSRYRRDRTLLIPPDHRGPAPSGGVGGSDRGVKCLHAHYADHAAGNDNPVGEWVAAMVEPLDDRMPCVVEVAGVMTKNQEWRQPTR